MSTTEERLDLYIRDDKLELIRNFSCDTKDKAILLINNAENKMFIELLDLILHPGKRNLYVHDVRNSNVFSKVDFAINSEDGIVI